MDHNVGNREYRQSPVSKGPTGWITLFIVLKSAIFLRFSDFFFFLTRVFPFAGRLFYTLRLLLLLYQLFKCLQSFFCYGPLILPHRCLITILGSRLLVCQHWPLVYIWKLSPCDVTVFQQWAQVMIVLSHLLSIPSLGASTISFLIFLFALLRNAGILIWVPHYCERSLTHKVFGMPAT